MHCDNKYFNLASNILELQTEILYKHVELLPFFREFWNHIITEEQVIS